MNKSAEGIERLLNIMKRLRSECPWDAKQTHQSLKQYLVEETYETLEAVDSEDWNLLASELGDLLLQIVFHSEIASESGHFDFSEVVSCISEKLIKRHPHVFDSKKVHNAREVQDNWEHSKVIDEERQSILSGIPKAAPSLLQAQRLQDKAAAVGFEWDTIQPVLEKFEEEWNEFKNALANGDQNATEKEFGDILFSIVNLSRYFNICAEDALRLTNKKFVRRFQYIERQYNYDPKAMKSESLEQLDKHWIDAKKLE